MQIEVIKVDVENKGKYRVANVAHKTVDGKVEGKKVMSFGAGAEAFKVLSEAQPGDVFEVKSEKIAGKDGKDYWTWTAAESAGKSTGNVRSTGNVSPRSTYETPEERAQRQIYIIRQSQISNAIALLTHNSPKNAVDVGTVVAYARYFENYVFNGEVLDEVEVI